MKHPSQRLKQLIDSLGMNINSFSKECGYPSSATIWRIIDDNKKPSSPTLDKICSRFPQVNREWLMTGLGNMLNTTAQSNDDLTLTASQVINKLLPLIPNKESVEKVHQTIKNVEVFFKEFFVLKNEIQEIKKTLSSIEFIEALQAIERKRKKESNGQNDNNL